MREENYTVSLLNQYANRTVAGAVDVMGCAMLTNSVTINSQTSYRRGEYFRKELSVANTSTPAWQSVTVSSGGSNVTGNAFIPKTTEIFDQDSDGNLKEDGRWTYTWDGENRLITMESDASAPSGSKLKLNFAYDAQGRRIQKIVFTNSGSSYVGQYTNSFIYDGWNLLASVGPNSSLQNTFIWGIDVSGTMEGAGGVGGLLMVRDASNSATHYTMFDGNGNLAELVNATDGTISAQYEYGPFGELLRATGPIARGNPFRFSTKYQDNETDQVYYTYRLYNPSTGRWLSRDPIDEGEIDQNHNAESYAYGFNLNDPIQYYDYLGNAAKKQPKKKEPKKPGEPKPKPPQSGRCTTDKECMRCLLFHEGRGKESGCLKLLRDVIVNRAKELGHSTCEEAKSGSYSNAKKEGSNYSKCCNQTWCPDITKINGKKVKPYNPDKEDMKKIDEFVEANSTSTSDNSEAIRFHSSISKPKDWSSSYVEIPTPECPDFKFYKKVASE